MTRTENPDEALRRYRRPEPVFVRAVAKVLGSARTVLELRSGPVSYVPADRSTTTPSTGGTADAVLVTFPTRADDLAGLRARTTGPVVVLARDPEGLRNGWLAEYAAEVVETEASALPTLDEIAAALGTADGPTRLPVPFTCVDGFSEAYYARPERLLDPGARSADPAWSGVDDLTARRSVAALRAALESGEWDARHGALRRRPTLDGSVVLLRTPAEQDPTRPA
ncbi:SAM-dependent methyltransferase [Curtobacterium sp. MCSS17_008]|uniref:SAM-dependent methyltransferase n=1 Tax=Curtobacterium sp. MCSS17_008 TaxID=2175647 RepID=UPI000DAA94AC|nr:SAM-dependent methyltransferase [Curtobacterium sp. MCSS17_008]PZF57275.1 SAM-dependent methyltransferase [Curtobacterium sp. MCSS17_008]